MQEEVNPEENAAPPTEQQAEKRPMSLEEFQQARSEEILRQMGGAEAAPDPSSETAPQDGDGQPLGAEGGSEYGDQPPGGEETDGSDDTEDALSQILSNATPEQIRDLAQKGQSRLLDRVSELTRRAKEAEEKLAQAQGSGQQEPPIEEQLQPATDSDEKPNSFSEVTTIEGLQEQMKQVDEVIEWAEDLLFQAEDSRPDEVLATVNGNQMTKADIRNSLRLSKKAKEKEIPERARQIQDGFKRQQERKQYEEAARAQLPWMSDDNSEIRQTYEAMMKDPRVAKLEQRVPELSSQFPFLIAHAANSIAQSQKKAPAAAGTGATPKPKPPASPNTSASGGKRVPSTVAKALSEQKERVKQTRSQNDFIAYRAAQLANR